MTDVVQMVGNVNTAIVLNSWSVHSGSVRLWARFSLHCVCIGSSVHFVLKEMSSLAMLLRESGPPESHPRNPLLLDSTIDILHRHRPTSAVQVAGSDRALQTKYSNTLTSCALPA